MLPLPLENGQWVKGERRETRETARSKQIKVTFMMWIIASPSADGPLVGGSRPSHRLHQRIRFGCLLNTKRSNLHPSTLSFPPPCCHTCEEWKWRVREREREIESTISRHLTPDRDANLCCSTRDRIWSCCPRVCVCECDGHLSRVSCILTLMPPPPPPGRASG